MRIIPVVVLAAACNQAGFETISCKDIDGPCEQFSSEDVALLFERSNTLEDGLTLLLGQGEFALDNQLTLRGATGITLMGQGMDLTTLDLSLASASQVNGVDSVGDGFTIQDLTIQDATKDALRVEDSSNIVIRRVRTTWSAGASSENGAYGIYPVRVSHVLVEDSEALYASDAGLYVGQCQHAVVRNNIARGNVAGIEIENTQYANVYGNIATDNTAGLVVFDLPGNPIIGRDVHIHDNEITNNNRPNFAPSGIVRSIPAGTGTFMLASRRVLLENNTWTDNNTVAVAVLSGLAVESDPQTWSLAQSSVIGPWEDLELPTTADSVMNFRSLDITVANNTLSGNGTAPDVSNGELRELGLLLALLFGEEPVDELLYDGIGESSFSTDTSAEVSNDNRICIGSNGDADMVTLDLGNLLAGGGVPTIADVYQTAAPYAPYDCDGLTAADLVVAELPAGITE